MLYRILLPNMKPDDVSMTIDVEADNWMLALRYGLDEIGADRELVKRAVCEINGDNSINVIEPEHGRVFVLREINDSDTAHVVTTPRPRRVPERTETPVLLGHARPTTGPVFAQRSGPALPKVTSEIPTWALDVPSHQSQPPLPIVSEEEWEAASHPDRIRAVTPRFQATASAPDAARSERTTQDDVLTSAPPLAAIAPTARDYPLNEADLEKSAEPRPKRTISHLDLNALHQAQVKRPREVGREPSRNLVADIRSDLAHAEVAQEDILSGVFEAMQEIDFVSQTVEGGLRYAIDVAQRFLPSEAAWLLLSDLNRSDLYFAVTTGPKAEEVKAYRLPLGKGIAGFCVVHGVSLSLSDVDRDPRFQSEISRSIGYPLNSVVCAPVETDGNVYGAIQLMNHKLRGEFTVAELDALSYVAKRTAEYLSQYVGEY